MKALVVLSGGQDSVTCLFWAVQKYGAQNVGALTVNYGQRHSREIEAARETARLAGIELRHEIYDVPGVLQSASPLTSNNALETYESAEQMAEVIGDRVELTFVPLRNPFFLVLAMNYAISRGYDVIVTGVCQEDNANYPDCRQSFIDAFHAMASEALGQAAPVIETPLMNFSKAETVKLALTLPGCYHALSWSHTAYSGEFPPVTQDHATVLRASGFADAGVPDPLIVRAHCLANMPLPPTPNYDVVRELHKSGYYSIGSLGAQIGAAA